MLPKYLGPSTLAITIVTLAAGLVSAAPRQASAQSSDGALVLNGCPATTTFYGRSDGYTYQVCADIVFTPSGNVNATLHGALLNPATAPSQPVIVRNFPCAYNGQSSNQSQIVITPDGNDNGYCQLHSN